MTTAADDMRGTQIDICQESVSALVAEHSDISGALVSTVDGFAVAAALRPRVSGDRLAAMTSSFVALAKAISHESGTGDCRDMVVEGSGGRVLLMDVPHDGQTLVLTVLCDATATLGQVLWAARQCRGEMSERLRQR